MLEDFLEVNGVDAEIVSFPRDTNIKSALFELKMSPSSAIVADFVMNEKDQEFVLVYGMGSKLSLEKVKQITGSFELFGKSEEEVFDATGYQKQFLPPVGIYGVRVYLDRALQAKQILLCKVGERSFLKIAPDEIIDANEDAFVESIT